MIHAQLLFLVLSKHYLYGKYIFCPLFRFSHVHTMPSTFSCMICVDGATVFCISFWLEALPPWRRGGEDRWNRI